MLPSIDIYWQDLYRR